MVAEAGSVQVTVSANLDAYRQSMSVAEARARQFETTVSASYKNVTGAINAAAKAQEQMNTHMAKAASSAASLNAQLNVKNSFGGAAAAKDVAEYGKAMDDLRAKYNPLFAAQRTYRETLDEINTAAKAGALTEKERSAAIATTKQGFASQVGAMKSAADATQAATGATTKYNEQLAVIQRMMLGLAGHLGIVGTLLSGMGPAGLIAAVGIGAAVKVIEHFRDQAAEFGRASSDLVNFSRNAGVSVVQMRALQIAGADAGVGAEALASRFSRFTVSLNEAHKATGPLYDGIRQIDAGLADQISNTTTTAEAWDVLAKALTRGTSASNALATSAFGRGGVVMVQVAAITQAAGGLDAYTRKQKENIGVTEMQVKVANDLKNAIDENYKVASLLYQKMFALEVLRREKEFSEVLKTVLIDMNKLNDTGHLDWLDKLRAWRATSWPKWLLEFVGFDEGDLEKIKKDIQERVSKLSFGITVKITGFTTTMAPGGAGILPSGAFVPDPKDINAATKAYNKLKESMDILGPAATSTERIAQETKRLAAAIGDAGDKARALSVFKENETLQGLSARIGLLGQAASLDDVRLEKQLSINKANRDGANISAAQAVIIKDIAAATALGTQAMKQQAAASGVEAATYGMAAGAAAELTAKLNALNAIRLAGREPSAAEFADIEKYSQAAGAAAAATEKVKFAKDLAREQKYAFLSPEDVAIADKLKGIYGEDIPKALRSWEAGQLRIINQLKTMKGYAQDFGQAMLSALAQGKSPKEAVGGAINAVGTKMSSDLMTAGIASGNPGMIAGAIGIAMLQGAAAKAKQAKADFDAAVDAWGKMATEVAHFTDTLTGKNTGSMGQSIASMTEKAQQYADAAHKAGQSSDGLNAALIVFVQKATRDFIVGFDVMAEALSQGLGSDSPAVRAQQNVKQIGDVLKGFVDDTVHAGQGLAQAGPAIAAATAGSQKYALSLLQTPPVLSEVETAILTLRGTAAQLGTTLQDLGMSAGDAAKAISEGIGAALDALRTKFTDSIQRQINESSGKGYINTTNDLIKSSVGSLNDANLLGTDPNQVAKSFALQAQQIVDGAGLIGDSFKEFIAQFPELADIVHVSASAFKTLTDAQTSAQTAQLTAQTNYDNALRAEQTKSLSDQQTAQKSYYDALRSDQTSALSAQTTAQQRLTTAQQAAVTAVNQLAAATEQFYSQLRNTISTYLHGLNAGSQSTLSPKDRLAAAQSDYSKQLSLAQTGDRTALGSITQYSTDLLSAAKDYFASSSGYQSIFNQIKTELAVLPDVAKASDPIVEQLKQANDFLAANNALVGTGNVIGSTGNDITSAEKELIDAQNAMVAANNALTAANNALTANGLSLTVDTNSVLYAQNAWVAANAALLASNNTLTANGVSLTANTNSVLDAQNVLVAANNALTIANNDLAAAGNTSTADAAASLGALQALQTATTQSSVNISASVTQLGAQAAFVADTQGSQYFGPMNVYLAQIAANTLLSGQPAAAPSSSFRWYNPFTWFHEGGIVGHYDVGGVVGNGLYNVDSVRARYAGGGDILLGGGEAVTRATSVNSMTMPTLDHINRTGSLPSNDNSNNGQHFDALGKTLVRAMAGVSMAEMGAMRDNIDALRSDIRRLADAMKTDKSRPRVPGTQTRAA